MELQQPGLVRPYALTCGRTVAPVDVALEAPLRTTESAESHAWTAGDVRSDIVALCRQNTSLAEVAATLNLPVGVARVLVGDLAVQGFLRVQQTLTGRSDRDERQDLIGRTLRGLRAL